MAENAHLHERAPRSWHFDGKDRPGPWHGSREPQLGRYQAACARPTARNRGPKGRGMLGRTLGCFFVVLDVSPERALAMSRGALVAPAGATLLKGLEVAGPFFSTRSVKKARDKWRAAGYPDARAAGYVMARASSDWPSGESLKRGVTVKGVRHWVTDPSTTRYHHEQEAPHAPRR